MRSCNSLFSAPLADVHLSLSSSSASSSLFVRHVFSKARLPDPGMSESWGGGRTGHRHLLAPTSSHILPPGPPIKTRTVHVTTFKSIGFACLSWRFLQRGRSQQLDCTSIARPSRIGCRILALLGSRSAGLSRSLCGVPRAPHGVVGMFDDDAATHDPVASFYRVDAYHAVRAHRHDGELMSASEVGRLSRQAAYRALSHFWPQGADRVTAPPGHRPLPRRPSLHGPGCG